MKIRRWVLLGLGISRCREQSDVSFIVQTLDLTVIWLGGKLSNQALEGIVSSKNIMSAY